MIDDMGAHHVLQTTRNPPVNAPRIRRSKNGFHASMALCPKVPGLHIAKNCSGSPHPCGSSKLGPTKKQQLDGSPGTHQRVRWELMIALVLAVIAYCRTFFIGRHRLGLEVAALRQQLVVFKRKQPRPHLCDLDRTFWVALRRLWPGWANALIIVKPDTVVSWHRAAFRLFWRWRSRPKRLGRPSVSVEIQQLIRRMKSENPSWGAPRIHGELLQLGFEVSEPTVSRYLQRLKRQPDKSKVQRWLAFVQNHREVIAAFDFFTVPTLSFRVLYCFFVIEHQRRRILHFNVTAHPTSDWILQQLREALPLPCPYRYVIFDRDRKFGAEVRAFLKASGIKSVRTSVRSPWQNGVAERWVGSIPPRDVGSRHPAGGATSDTAQLRICSLLSRRQNSYRTE